jgi:cyclopropane-fatty-acyl-phospholipid synthase
MLKDQGLFLLHTIGNSTDTTVVDPWIEKYIFRNSMAPSMAQLVMSKRGHGGNVYSRVNLLS